MFSVATKKQYTCHQFTQKIIAKKYFEFFEKLKLRFKPLDHLKFTKLKQNVIVSMLNKFCLYFLTRRV